MTASKNTDHIMFSKIAEGLDSTSQLVHALLNEIKDSEADFAAVKTELSILRDNVKGLSEIVREGNGATSLITQMALIQQRIESIDRWVDSHSKKHQAINISYNGLEDRLDDVQARLMIVENFVSEQVSINKEREKEFKDSINKEREIEHQKELSFQKESEEKRKFKIGLVAAIIIGVITAAASIIPKLYK